MRVSVIYETKAILPPDAPKTWDHPYLDLVVMGKTTLSPHSLLESLKRIEKELGRDHNAKRWGPRTIDLDILAWDEQVIEDETLCIPHRELFNRPFLLNLMASLNPQWRYPQPNHPYTQLTLGEIIHRYTKPSPYAFKCYTPSPHLVGVVNVTPDSFSDGGHYASRDRAVEKICVLAEQGAAVIDIGAQSTRPGSPRITPEEEWKRLEPVFIYLAEEWTPRASKPRISLDTYYPEVMRRALEYYPVDWINDVKGGEDPRFLEIMSTTTCKMVLNHSLGIPPTDHALISFDRKPINHILEWAKSKIDLFTSHGIDKERLILDPGIGFGNSAFQALSLLRDIHLLKELGCEVLIGHSRKSFLKPFSIGAASERDPETIGMSHYLLRADIDYLRVHNVEAHHKSLLSALLLEGGYALA